MATRRSARAHRVCTFDLQEGGQELVFVLFGGYGVGELLAIVEWLQKGLEAVIIGLGHFAVEVRLMTPKCSKAVV